MDQERDSLSRRDLFGLASKAASIGVLATAVAACGDKGPLCSDPNKLTDDEIAIRTSMRYVEKSPEANKVCKGCAYFDGSSGSPCGTCRLLRGPVNPGGHCDSWSAAKKG